MRVLKLKDLRIADLVLLLFIGGSLQSPVTLASDIFIDVSSGTPVVWSTAPDYWTSIPFDGLHSSVTQLASGAWEIDIGLVGAFRGWGNIRGLELTDPQTGAIVDSFGEDYVVYNNLYSWTTLYTELYTTNSSGQLAGRYRYADGAYVL